MQKGNELYLNQNLVNFLYHLKYYDEIDHPESYRFVNDHLEYFDEIMDNIEIFAKKYLEAEGRLETIKRLYAEFKEKDDKDIKLLADSFIELLKLTSFGAPKQFNFLGKSIERKRYTSFKDIWDGEIVYQSLTGLYETRIKLED